MTNEENPLQDLYEDKENYNRKRLAEALVGVIGIDQESGDPIFKNGYHQLTNKEKFVAQLLYRRAANALGDIEESEIGLTSGDAASNLEVSSSSVTNYGSELMFVDHDGSKGGYYIPGFGIEQAIEFILDEIED